MTRTHTPPPRPRHSNIASVSTYEQIDYTAPRLGTQSNEFAALCDSLRDGLSETLLVFGARAEKLRVYSCGSLLIVTVELSVGQWTGHVRMRSDRRAGATRRLCAKVLRLLERETDALG